MINMKSIFGAVLTIVMGWGLGSCGSKQQPKSYVSVLTSDDSMIIQMGQWDLIKYHSDKLGLILIIRHSFCIRNCQARPVRKSL